MLLVGIKRRRTYYVFEVVYTLEQTGPISISYLNRESGRSHSDRGRYFLQKAPIYRRTPQFNLDYIRIDAA